MKRKRVRSARKTNWRAGLTSKPVFWVAVVLVLALVISHPSVRSWFRVMSSKAFSWTIVQMTNETGYEWAIDSSGSRVVVAKGDMLYKPKNLYVYNASTPAKPPIKILATDVAGGDAYLASAKIDGDKVVYSKVRDDNQGVNIWLFTINPDNISGINTKISPDSSTPSTKRFRVRPDISGSKIIYQNFDISGGGSVRRGDLVMVDAVPNAPETFLAGKVAIVGNKWEYEEPSVNISSKIDGGWVVWRDYFYDDLQHIGTVGIYACKVSDPTNKITLLPPATYPAVGSFDILGSLAVASITTKGAGDTTNTNIYTCDLANCIPTLKLVNVPSSPYVGTQVNLKSIWGNKVVYVMEKPKSTGNPAPIHQKWYYKDLVTGENSLIAELGSSSNTTVLTQRYERPLLAAFGTNKFVSVITKREAPGGMLSYTDANIFAAIGY